MANSVHLSGLLRVDEIRTRKGLGVVIQVTLFDQTTEKQRKGLAPMGYPVHLTGEQAEIVLQQSKKSTNGQLPNCVITGRLFCVDERECVVIGKHIQFTGAYGHPYKNNEQMEMS